MNNPLLTLLTALNALNITNIRIGDVTQQHARPNDVVSDFKQQMPVRPVTTARKQPGGKNGCHDF